MKLVVLKHYLGGQILSKSSSPSKKRRLFVPSIPVKAIEPYLISANNRGAKSRAELIAPLKLI